MGQKDLSSERQTFRQIDTNTQTKAKLTANMRKNSRLENTTATKQILTIFFKKNEKKAFGM